MDNIVFSRTLHKELWCWLAENQECTKEDWPQWISNGGTVENVVSNCFACEYDKDNRECDACPIIWSGSNCYEGEFRQWEHSEDPQERTRLALAIADLPVREGVVCE